MKIKQGLYVFVAVIFIFFLYSEYQKAQRLNLPEGSFNIGEISQIHDANNKYLEDLKGLILNRHSPIEVHRLSPESCFFAFEHTWFGTIEIKLPEDSTSNFLNFKLGELADNKRVLNAPKVGMPNVAYFEQSIDLRRLSLNKGVVNLPSKVMPDNKKLPFKLQGVMPFKYVEIMEGCDRNVEKSLTQLSLTYPFNVNNSSFISNDIILNEVYNLSKHTIKATSFTGLYIDGYREVKPYEADAYINQLGHYAIDADYMMARNTQEYLLSHGTWPTEWIMHSVFMAYQDYMQTGDKAFIEANYNKLKMRTLTDFSKGDFLISSNEQTSEFLLKAGIQAKKLKDIIDWPQNERDNYSQENIKLTQYLPAAIVISIKKLRLLIIQYLGLKEAAQIYKEDITNATYKLTGISSVNTVVNAFHFSALNKMAILAKEIGQSDDATFFEQRALKVKKSIQGKLFDEGQGVFLDAIGSSHSSIHANVFALVFGLVAPEKKEGVLDFILSRHKGSVYLHQYLLEALYQNGKGSEAFAILTSKKDRSWHYMKHVLGSDMTTESWNFNVKKNMDFNHSWSTAPVNIIPRYILGIRPIIPRYERFIVAPVDRELDSYSAMVPTLDGNISLDMQRNEGIVVYKLAFTGDKKADLQLLRPLCQKFSLAINNRSRELEPSNLSDEHILFQKLNSGKYKIIIQCKKYENRSSDV